MSYPSTDSSSRSNRGLIRGGNYRLMTEQAFEVVLKSDKEWTCVCPWCGSSGSKPTLYVNVLRGLYVCFKCHEKGRMDSLGAVPNQTTQGLRERLKVVKAPKQEQHFYPEGWLKQYDMPTTYWTDERDLSPDIVQKFGLGFDPFTNRATLPLRDMHGRILGVTFRNLAPDARPKYLHPKGFPVGRHLYGAWLLTGQKKVALVEGQVDAVSCWQDRVPALGLMGSRITKDQIKVLQRLGITTVVLMLDNDNAGLKGTVEVIEALKGSGIRVQVGWYRPYWVNCKDPDSLKPDRKRKFYHSAVSPQEWAKIQIKIQGG